MGAKVYVNNIYQVMVYRGHEADELVHVEELKGKCTWLSIKRRDKRQINNWNDMQDEKSSCGYSMRCVPMFHGEQNGQRQSVSPNRLTRRSGFS